MHLLMAERAVLEARVAQIVKCRTHRTYSAVGGRGWRRQIRVALQADKAHFRPGQHPRVRRSVRLMARGAAFQPDRRMLKRKRPRLVAVALEAPRLVGFGGLERARQDAASVR